MKKIAHSVVAGLALAASLATAAQADSVITQQHPIGWTTSGNEAVPLYSEEQHPITARTPVGWVFEGGESVPQYAEAESSIEPMGVNGHTGVGGRSHLEER